MGHFLSGLHPFFSDSSPPQLCDSEGGVTQVYHKSGHMMQASQSEPAWRKEAGPPLGRKTSWEISQELPRPHVN